MALKLPAQPLLWKLPRRDPCFLCRLPTTFRAGLKTKTRHRDITTVELCAPVPGWGNQGAILQVPRGLMRNTLYPQGQALYIPFRQARQVALSGRIQPRDPSFMKNNRKAKDVEASTPAATEKTIEEPERPHAPPRLSNEDSLKLIDELASPRFSFSRPVQGQATPDENGAMPIFGSVSKREIADVIKESVSVANEAAVIRLDESNVEIFEGKGDKHLLRIIKTTGRFTVAIAYPDLGYKVYREVTVAQVDDKTPSG